MKKKYQKFQELKEKMKDLYKEYYISRLNFYIFCTFIIYIYIYIYIDDLEIYVNMLIWKYGFTN